MLVAIHPNTGEIIAEPFTDYPQGAAWALDWNGKGWNLYWTVNLTRRGLSKKASKADIQAARAFWADVDPDTKRSGDYLTARAHLLNGVLTELVAAKSTIIIDSGSGLQPLFLLNHPIALNGHMEAYEQLNAKVGAKFHGPGTFNYDRILRLPFTLNYPTKSKLARGYPDTPSMARVIDCSGIRYGEEEIARLCRSRVEEFLESHPKAKARWGGSREGLNDATGSGFDFSMVAMLKAGGLSEEEVKEALYSWAQGSKDGRGSREWDRYFRRCWERTANIHDTQAATEPGKETDAETITRLAALSLLEYSRVRKGEAERLGVRVTDLDAEVKRAREGARVDLSAAGRRGRGRG
jgi:hypothetical protein